ncbi:DNA binding domain-containing protein, excisionase family [Streptococcus henryi]|uniref:DNA binding domain-containing protein, excisionase family n=1 Tax=Streptococcus henryi TaxID=439219 RepID=A0A1G6DQ09_9STRE|nr:helix-turn-helix domain-containing protein [Streptococcus henryi]SDB47218.1 DNA binding domain-containing protein, excisionase family [Streptococcus henryi]
MQVMLAEEQTLEIQQMIGELIKSEIKNARKSVGADSPFLNKRQTCDYLGISNNTLDLWISMGLPYIKIGKSIRFNKDSVNQWMTRLEISA